MKIEKKYMEKNNWKRVIERQYVCYPIEEKTIQGIASLLYIKKVTNPSIKVYKNDIKVKIVDKNFYWLQLAIENENYWITAMYDSEKKIIQYYIDITEKNVINKNGKAYFYDLFLDIVLLNSGEIILLDEDELRKALDEKVITKKQYDLAYNKANDIIELIKKDKSILEDICNNYFKILLSKLENK